MDRQKIIKVVVAMVVAFSVFFSHTVTAHAASPVGPYDNNLTVSFSSMPAAVMLSSAMVLSPTESGVTNEHFASFSGSSDVQITLLNTADVTLYVNGYIEFYAQYTRSEPSGFQSISIYGNGNIVAGDGYTIGLFRSGFIVPVSGASNLLVRLSLSDYALSPDTLNTFATTVDFYGSGYYVVPVKGSITPSVSVTGVSASDYAGNFTVTDKPLGEAGYIADNVGSYIDNSTTTIINNADTNNQQAMQQQQQIADAQAKQSAEQHKDLVSGYDSAKDNAMLENKNQELADYEAKQGAAFDSANQYVTDYSKNFDPVPFVNLAPSFALIQVWFALLWNGIGPFAPVLAVSLTLCVAGYILKIRH